MPKLKERYLSYFPEKGLIDEDIKKIEKKLSVILPDDLKKILKYYDGYYDLAGFSLFSFLIKKGSWNICTQTELFRKTINLPKEYVVLKEGDESFIILKTQKNSQMDAPVFWIGSSDVYNLVEKKELYDNPMIFPTFPDFFKFLLDEEEKSRNESTS